MFSVLDIWIQRSGLSTHLVRNSVTHLTNTPFYWDFLKSLTFTENFQVIVEKDRSSGITELRHWLTTYSQCRCVFPVNKWVSENNRLFCFSWIPVEQAVYNRPPPVDKVRVRDRKDTVEAYQLAQRLQSVVSSHPSLRNLSRLLLALFVRCAAFSPAL